MQRPHEQLLVPKRAVQSKQRRRQNNFPLAAVYWLIREHEIQTGVNTKSVAMY